MANKNVAFRMSNSGRTAKKGNELLGVRSAPEATAVAPTIVSVVVAVPPFRVIVAGLKLTSAVEDGPNVATKVIGLV